MKRAAALLSSVCEKTQAHPEGASRLFRKPMGVNERYDSLPGNCSFQVKIVERCEREDFYNHSLRSFEEGGGGMGHWLAARASWGMGHGGRPFITRPTPVCRVGTGRRTMDD
jgi:hypothetical protein